MFDLVCKFQFVKFLEEFVKFMILLWLGKYFGIILGWIGSYPKKEYIE